jgi:glucose-1-phosphatase
MSYRPGRQGKYAKATLLLGLQCYIFGFNNTTHRCMKKLENIDFLVFDLGNVVIDIDYDFSINELKKKLPEHKHQLTADFFPSQFHKDFEKGFITAEHFRKEIKSLFNEEIEDLEIDFIWNSLLRDLPLERIQLIQDLKQHYGTAVLSNTNSIHIEKFDKILLETAALHSLADLFDHVFLSHEMGLSKPDEKIYQKVVEVLGTTPERILFFDDLEANLAGAKRVGLQTYHITHPKALVEFFQHV